MTLQILHGTFTQSRSIHLWFRSFFFYCHLGELQITNQPVLLLMSLFFSCFIQLLNSHNCINPCAGDFRPLNRVACFSISLKTAWPLYLLEITEYLFWLFWRVFFLIKGQIVWQTISYIFRLLRQQFKLQEAILCCFLPMYSL